MEENLTGRISMAPSQLLHEEVLEPQFRYEVENLLPAYIQIEQAMLLEYIRMNWITAKEGYEISQLLHSINHDKLVADPERNMSDIAFGIERLIESSLSSPISHWHMDRSRNDFQACAQLIFGRTQWLELMTELLKLIKSMDHLASRYTEMVMPGYTHYQSAQIITPGFYLSSINQELLQTLKRWISVYDDLNKCPLGSGAMAGVELDWDRERLASLLGFTDIRHSALGSVASREWLLYASSELSIFSVLISRFTTDLIQWGSSEMNFIDLPDQLSGISSAMPQKKNFPILERIRGKSAHLSSFYLDIVLGQRNTPFTNLVETSKEAGTHQLTMYRTTKSLLLLLKTVIDHLSFHEERMLSICKRDFFGGFTLSNLLTLEKGIPYRKAQVIVGRYIMSASNKGLSPAEVDAQMLREKCLEEGFEVTDLSEILNIAFDIQKNLLIKKSSGSTNPERVKELLLTQKKHLQQFERELEKRRDRLAEADTARDKCLAMLKSTEGNGVGMDVV